MTNGEAGAVRACLWCGAPGAGLYRTTKGAYPGRALRLCEACLSSGDWWEYGLVKRDADPRLHEVVLDDLVPLPGDDHTALRTVMEASDE